MTKDKAKELLNKIEKKSGDDFIDSYLDSLFDTIDGSNAGQAKLLISQISNSGLTEEEDKKFNLLQEMKIDALSLIYDVYCNLKLSLNGSLLDKDESPSRDEHRDLHQLYKDAE